MKTDDSGPAVGRAREEARDRVREALDAAGLLRSGELFDTTPDEVEERRTGAAVPLMAGYGGGLNSSAGLVLLAAWGDVPDAILMADTGGEKARTYTYRDLFSDWLVSVGFPSVVTVRRNTDPSRQKGEEKYTNLEEECHAKRCLPSIAYYGRSCSDKWKQWPQNTWANNWPPAQARWAAGGRVVKAIFYDGGEAYRAKVYRDAKYTYWHPLLSVNWGRAECVAALEAVGLPIPPKSSCFFCPEMTPREIFELQDTEPELLARALAMEANADLTSIKGLGKHEYSWAELIAGRVPLATIEKANKVAGRLPCMCHDDASDE